MVSEGLAGGIRRAQFPTQLYLFASWGVGALGGHQTDIFITSKHKYTNTNTDTNTDKYNNIYRYTYRYKFYLFTSWGVGASGGHQTALRDIFITSKHKYAKGAV